MNEERYAHRVRQTLNHGLQDISPAASRRLEAARHLALSRQKQPEARLALSGDLGSLAFLPGSPIPYLKQILAVLALLAGMWLSFYWHSVQYISELEEIDSALLAEDLPPEAFMDDEFFTWLKEDSSPD
ncbi:MAG: putative transrane protein [Proteobacteria bacterium]|nr:putative transrane protein [Pseudomonadota bacterium]